MSSLDCAAYASAKEERDLIDAELFFHRDSSARRPLPRFPEPCTNKVHWEHLLEEMSWLSKDFVRERKWRQMSGRKCAASANRRYQAKQCARERRETFSQLLCIKLSSQIAREVCSFWRKINKLVSHRKITDSEQQQKAEMERQLAILLSKTEKFSSEMARNLSLKPTVCTGSFSSSEQTYVLRRKQSKRKSDRGKAHSNYFEEPFHLSTSHNASTQVAEQVDYKPAHDEEWDDLESFDEQVRLEKESNMDAQCELQSLQEEADLPVEELLKRYKRNAAIIEDSSGHPSLSEWSPERNKAKIEVDPPFLLKFELRDYQKFGLKWLASCYNMGVNAMLADEMGLGKTIQTIGLLAHLACEHGVWGPHLIIVPTSVMVNWEVEFKKWCPALKILTYFGTQKERKLKRAGWSKPNTFNICITTYRIAVQDQAIFRRKRWNYLILDEAHMIKNWRSQRWQTLLTFESCHRLLITGTPLQNDVMELWALMHFLMPDLFQSHAEFKNWFSNPLVGMAEGKLDIDDRLTARLHAVLRPFILRRLKADVERSLPSKVEHIVKCRLSRRQKRLYDEYMSSNDTVQTLNSSNIMGVMNCLMQLRKVCNHPDIFAGRNIISAYDMPNVLEFIYPTIVSRMLLSEAQLTPLHSSEANKHCVRDIIVHQRRSLRETFVDIDTYLMMRLKSNRSMSVLHRQQLKLEGNHLELAPTLTLYDVHALRSKDTYIQSQMILDHHIRARELIKFMFRIPTVRARTPIVRHELASSEQSGKVLQKKLQPLRELMIRGHLVFPDARLVQYDCGKLQALASLLRSLKSAGHKVVIFTQMTKVLDILERFLNLYSYSYVRLDGTTKPDQRQILMQRFNADSKLFAFILSTRSGGFGINLTGADTVIFYDSDWNPAVDAQAQDRCHRIGQTKEVNIYRLISEDTIEENIWKKALQKRELDELAIQKGQFNLSSLNQYGENSSGAERLKLDQQQVSRDKTKQGSVDLEKIFSLLTPVEKYALRFAESESQGVAG